MTFNYCDIILKIQSVFYAEDDEYEIISTKFNVHEDLDACLVRIVPDMSHKVDKIPCLIKDHFEFI